jgi:molybdopterin/thiamine biosynthesis adenylyltransferase
MVPSTAIAIAAPCSPKSVAVIGLGNIGAFTAALVARLPRVGRLTLFDRDLYEAKNIVSQDIGTAAVGRLKALVQAERLCQINPYLRVEAVVGDIEDVPLGLLRADVLLACLDSRRARQAVNQAAWRLGIPWIDAGVRTDDLLARVNVYLPGFHHACMECAWSQRDYEVIEQTYPCASDAPLTAGTNAPAGLGALAAALQVLECQKLCAGEWERLAVDKQVLVGAARHTHCVTRFRRNAACRFDHAAWHIEPLDQHAEDLSVGAAFALLATPTPLPFLATDAVEGRTEKWPALRLEGQVFVKKLTCPRCGDTRELPWRLSGRLGPDQHCARCGRRRLATAFDVVEWLRPTDLPSAALAQPLHSLGFRTADVLTVRDAKGARHFQLGVTDRAQDAAVEALDTSLFGACG